VLAVAWLGCFVASLAVPFALLAHVYDPLGWVAAALAWVGLLMIVPFTVRHVVHVWRDSG
jgi:hypothetical protein